MPWIKRNFQEKLQRACSILLATDLPSHPKRCQLIVVDKYLFKRTNKDASSQHSDLFPVDYWRWSYFFNSAFEQVFADYEIRNSLAKFYLFKVNNRNTRTTSLTFFWCFYCCHWTYFTPFSIVFIINIEQVNAGWAIYLSIASFTLEFIRKQILK